MKRPELWLAAAVALLFAPNLIHFSDAAIGASASDALKHVWSQWVVHQQIGAGEPFAMTTRLIHHPTGGPFFSLDTANAWMGLPLRSLMGSVAAYNAGLLLNVFAAGWAAMVLARRLASAPESQLIAAVVFSISAWVLCFPLGSGVSETAVFWPVPLIAVAAVRTWDTPGWRWPLAGGLLLLFQGIACWSHGITAGLMLLGLAMSQRTRWSTDKDRLIRCASMVGVAAVAALPLYLAISGTVTADDAVKTRALSLFHAGPVGPLAVPEANSMALIDFFLPGSWGRRISQAGTEQLMYAAYPGWIALGLGALAVRRRLPAAKLLVAGALFFALMSMGPRIYLDHARSMGGVPNPIYLVAYWTVPLVNATIHSVDRFAVGVQLCVALLAAIGAATLTLKQRRLALAAVAVEILLIAPGDWPLPMVKAQPHPVSVFLEESSQSGAVIDVPYMSGSDGHTWFNGDVFLQQTVHGRPIPFQLEGHGIETAHPQVAANPYFMALSANRGPENACEGVDGLAAMGIGWVVLRPGADASVTASLDTCLTRVMDAEDRVLFRIATTP